MRSNNVLTVGGYAQVAHRRSVFFVPGRYAVIYDLVDGSGEHEVVLHCPYGAGPVPKPTIEIDPVADDRVRVTINGKTDRISPAGIN